MQKDGTEKTKSARKPLIFLAVLLIVLGVLIFATFLQNKDKVLEIGGVKIAIKYARTPAEKQRGLCCRNSLPENSGMLFMYHSPGNYRFWMKDTHIPLDMYWISQDKKIVHIEENVQPSSYPRTFGTNQRAQYILETNAGFAKKHNIQIDDRVKF